MRKNILCAVAVCLLFAFGALAQPSIRAQSGVLHANSYAPDVPRGGWFVIFGAGMGPATLTQASALPFPTELAGTRVTFTPAAGGTAIDCRIWYTLAGQVAGLLPSSTAAGDYDVRVIYNGATSAPSRVKVVERNFGFATANSAGFGPAQATNASLNGGVSLVRFTVGTIGFGGRTWQYRPAYPSETLVLWGSGLGADSASDATGATSGDMTVAAQVAVIVGGVEITPGYAGRSSGSPGLDQINFTLPPTVPQGCTVSLQVRAGGRLSNLGSLAIAASPATACQHPSLTAQQLQNLDAGGTVTIGSFSLSKSSISLTMAGIGSFTTTAESVGGSFSKFTGDQLTTAGGFTPSQLGDCLFMRRRGSTNDVLQGPVVSAADAGAQLILNGPNASNKAIPRAQDKSYNLDLYSSGFSGIGGTGSPTLSGGTYTLAGPGGAEIGPFSASSPFPANFDWTNKDSISNITRGQALNITWTGGGTEAGALVNIVGMSGTQVGGTQTDPIYEVGVFVCTVAANLGRFTVPGVVTNALSPVSGDMSTGALGLLSVAATPGENSGRFTAPVVSGGTAPSTFHYSWSQSKSVGVN